MTREEAIKCLKSLLEVRRKYCDMQTMRNEMEALEIAIKALEQEPCDDCVSRQAVLECFKKWQPYMATRLWEFEQELSALPSVASQPKMGRWIPVSERLPKPFSYVNCTLRSLIDDRAFWVVETCYVPQPKNSPYSDWGNIPMLNHGDCAVVAWMYREIPKPYKAESEEQGDEIQGET